MADQQKYPVFMERTVVHLIWVEAKDAEDAAKQVTQYPYEYSEKTGDPCDGHVIGYAPTEHIGSYDWDSVYGYAGAADEPDQHVTLHRIHLAEQARAAHAALGHPGVSDRTLHDKRWCPVCGWWVAIDPVSAHTPDGLEGGS